MIGNTDPGTWVTPLVMGCGQVPFYDNMTATPLPEERSLVEVERVYELAFDDFDESHWQALDRIYRTLPGSYRALQIPTWFGDDEPKPPFLSASVEPPGLQVYGVLRHTDWLAWDVAFTAALGISELPFRASAS